MVNQNDNYEIDGACSSKSITTISWGKNLKIATLKMLGTRNLAHASSILI